MAHILVAHIDSNMRSMLSDVLEGYDDVQHHWVTCVEDFWQLLSAMRSTLHPMVVVFEFFLVGYIRETGDEMPVSIMMRDEEDLRRHRLIEMHADGGERPPEVQAFYERLGVRHIRMPFELEAIIDLVNECAAELEPGA